MEVGTFGWLSIAAIVVLSALAIAPAARAAERHLARVTAVEGGAAAG
jgi:hypothetical protein